MRVSRACAARHAVRTRLLPLVVLLLVCLTNLPAMAAQTTAGLAQQSPPIPPCTDDTRSACWVEVANQADCWFWHADEIPVNWMDEVSWSGECSSGLAEGTGTVTWKTCVGDNRGCMPFSKKESGSFLNGRRQGRWLEGPLDAAGCHRWNTDMYFRAATLEEVTACLDSGADVNANADGYLAGTPLHHAVRKNELPLVKVLLNAGARVDARDTGGSTPLHEAAWRSDDPAIFEALLEAGADVNALDNNWNTPLHEFAEFNLGSHLGDISGARVLIDAGADVLARERYGYTPLHYAVRRDALPIIVFLLEAGADVNARADNGETPLHDAVEQGYTSTERIELLLAAGADVSARDERGRTPLDIANDHPRELREKLRNVLGTGSGPSGWRSWLASAWKRFLYLSWVRRLPDEGAEIDAHPTPSPPRPLPPRPRRHSPAYESLNSSRSHHTGSSLPGFRVENSGWSALMMTLRSGRATADGTNRTALRC